MTIGGVPPQLINHGLLIRGWHYSWNLWITKETGARNRHWNSGLPAWRPSLFSMVVMMSLRPQKIVSWDSQYRTPTNSYTKQFQKICSFYVLILWECLDNFGYIWIYRCQTVVSIQSQMQIRISELKEHQSCSNPKCFDPLGLVTEDLSFLPSLIPL